MNIKTLLLVAALAAPAVPAHAQTIDLATIKCKEFVESSKDNIMLIMMWLDGFYNDEEKTVVDFDKMKERGGRLGEYCAKNPDHGVLSAAEEVMK